MPGRRPFSYRTYPRADAQTVMTELLRDVAPEMESRGYRITQRADGRLRFELEYRRGLLRRSRREAVMIDVDEGDRGHPGRRDGRRAAVGPPADARVGTLTHMQRAVLVTGAASGIGRAIAARLERDGFDVLSVDLEADGPGVPFAADLTTREGNRDAVAKALDEFGRLDAVIPNAGFQHVAPVEEFPEDRWDAMIALLLTSPFLLARAAWPALRESGDGRFVAIASVHGLVASPFKSAYVSAKHGLLGLVKTLALEGAGEGISACALCPGYVRTPLVENQVTAQAEAHGMPEERVLGGGHPRPARRQAADRARRGGRDGRLPAR